MSDKKMKLTPLNFIKRQLMHKTFNFITRKSMNIFLRGNDIISVGPQIYGGHEEFLTSFIDNIADKGFSDFFIDIGANIGLSSCQNGGKFKKVICFEPNPLCINILKTNLSICLNENAFEVCEYALGESEGAFDLYVPIHNWGGAFVKNNNGYSDDILSKKDGFDALDIKNYVVRKVQVKNAETIFANLFSSLLDDGLSKGVVKIDVEGFERMVLLAIAKNLPSTLNVFIVFENWDPKFDLDEIKKSFINRSVEFKKFERSIVGTKKSKFRKIIEFALFGETRFLADCTNDEVVIGNLILKIQ